MDERIKASRAQEKRVAESLGGRVQPASGAGEMHKGDVRTDRYLIECKTTSKGSYRLTLDTLDKINREALLEGREFALFLEIWGCEYVVISKDHFVELTER